MRFSSEKKHVIDLIFPISLFFVFAATSLLVVLLAANVYSSTTEASESSFETRTVLSYIKEKIHQSDEEGAVSIGDFEGLDALIIRQSYGDHSYTTYIYEQDEMLRELFIQDGTEVSPADGIEIMPVRGFQMDQQADGLFRFSCISREGTYLETTVSTKSGR